MKSDANVLITNTSNLNGGLAHGGTDANKGFAQTAKAFVTYRLRMSAGVIMTHTMRCILSSKRSDII